MLARSTPGVYFEHVDLKRPAIGPLRTDIAGFVGYAERGPVLEAVKISLWRQFVATFGEPLPFAHLAWAVRGFFENGGASCYVVRVADPLEAAAAEAVLPLDESGSLYLRVWASHGVINDPATGRPKMENGRPVRVSSPGVWGNRLSISLLPALLGTTRTQGAQPADGSGSYVESLTGFRKGSFVRISSPGSPDLYRTIEDVDVHLRHLTWDAPLTGFDLTKPLTLETLECTLLVLMDGQVIERHTNLSFSAAHDRFIVDVVQANSRHIDVEVGESAPSGGGGHVGPPQLSLAIASFAPPLVDRLPLSGGKDGLATAGEQHFLAALQVLEKVDEVSMLAAPDVVLQPEAPPAPRRPDVPPLSCEILEPPPEGKLAGVVLEEGSDTALGGVRIVLVGGSASTTTDTSGAFLLENLPVGRVTLLLSRDGYYEREVTAEARTVLPTGTGVPTFYLSPITLPKALDEDSVFTIQQAMVLQGEVGLYRVALLDPPFTRLGTEAIQTWRARFDSSYAALFYPWLRVDTGAGGVLRDVPPSGHVAGLIARTDLEHGVHRAPANFEVRDVRALTNDVDDAVQGILNPLGINCLRVLPGRGIRLYGARTLSSDTSWRFLNVRRLLLLIEEAVEDAHQWAVFEPNNTVLRQALTYSLTTFLRTLWQQGALSGASPEAAFLVKCDQENNPPETVEAGRILAEISVAPANPFEFITFRLGRTVDTVKVTE